MFFSHRSTCKTGLSVDGCSLFFFIIFVFVILIVKPQIEREKNIYSHFYVTQYGNTMQMHTHIMWGHSCVYVRSWEIVAKGAKMKEKKKRKQFIGSFYHDLERDNRGKTVKWPQWLTFQSILQLIRVWNDGKSGQQLCITNGYKIYMFFLQRKKNNK